MAKDNIIKTELFEIYFSRDKRGKDNFKFSPKEKNNLITAIKWTEGTIIKVLERSKTPCKTI